METEGRRRCHSQYGQWSRVPLGVPVDSELVRRVEDSHGIGFKLSMGHGHAFEHQCVAVLSDPLPGQVCIT